MRRRNYSVLLTIFALAMCLSMAPACYAEAQTTYEYKVVRISGSNAQELEQQLNALGREGWELVSVNLYSNPFTNKAYTLFLKRKSL